MYGIKEKKFFFEESKKSENCASLNSCKVDFKDDNLPRISQNQRLLNDIENIRSNKNYFLRVQKNEKFIKMDFDGEKNSVWEGAIFELIMTF